MYIDWLGTYEIEWDENVSAAQRTTILRKFSNIETRLYSLMAETTRQLSTIQANRANIPAEKLQNYDTLVANMTVLRDGINETLNNMTSDYKLVIRNVSLGSAVHAQYIQYFWPPWKDDALEINSDMDDDSELTLFHELTHTWSTDDDESPFYENASSIENLYYAPLKDMTWYRLDYKNTFSVYPE